MQPADVTAGMAKEFDTTEASTHVKGGGTAVRRVIAASINAVLGDDSAITRDWLLKVGGTELPPDDSVILPFEIFDIRMQPFKKISAWSAFVRFGKMEDGVRRVEHTAQIPIRTRGALRALCLSQGVQLAEQALAKASRKEAGVANA